MSNIRVVVAGTVHEFAPPGTVTIGRSGDSAIVVDDPSVSREHAQLTYGPEGWVLTEVSAGRTFIGGAPVARRVITSPTEVRLSTPDGPALRIEPAETRAAAPVMPVVGAGVGAAPGHPDAMHEFASALHILVPLRSWLKNRGWQTGWRILLIPYALLPLSFITLYSNTTNATTPGWAYSLYVAPLWAIAFYMLIRPGRIGKKEVLAAALIVGMVLVWMQVVTITINNHLDPKHFGDALGVGFNEEITKALPVLVIALVIRKVRQSRWDVRMWMFLGTISGLTFGVREASLYTATSVLQINHNPGLVISGLLAFAYRVFVDGFQHAIWAGMSAFFVGMGVNYARRRIQLIVGGVTLAALLHALNDYVLSHSSTVWPGVAIQAVSLILFLGYTLTATSIERQVRRSPIFRGESILVDQFSESSPSG
jgi:RsiW-degrading membrane proteinase PrsW (M82 family)